MDPGSDHAGAASPGASLAAWVRAHPWLEPLARFHARLESVAADVVAPRAGLPDWDGYAPDFEAGVPLLHSEGAGLDLDPVAAATLAALDRLPGVLEGELAEGFRRLGAGLRAGGPGAPRVTDVLFGDDGGFAGAGLLRFLGWFLAARHLRPVVAAFAARRDDEKWARGSCPTCGSAPAMSQLVGQDPARLRLFVCGRCATKWRFRRTACPFCDHDAHRLAVIAVEGERHLRLDSCESCRGYLKAYVGEGEEAVHLADWTSLHLDVIAADRGLKRLAASLYDLPASLSG